MTTSPAEIREQAADLQARLADAEEMLRAIRQGEVDALVVEGSDGAQIYTLHSAEEPYRTLVEQMQEGAVVLTSDGDILYANARFAALVGEPLESISGTRFDRFVHPSDKDDVDRLLGTGSGRHRCRLLGPDAASCEVSLSLTTPKSARSDRRNLIVTDMTELLDVQRKKDQAERDRETREDLLAMVAYEMRSPMAAIGTAAQVLAVSHTDGEPAGQARDAITRQVDYVAGLIDDLLDVERVVSGAVRLDVQRIDLARSARHVVATFAADVRLNRSLEIDLEPVWIDGDAMRIRQVLTHLVANAVEATPPGGRIRVALVADGADAVLTVEDWGSGISSSGLPFIFEMGGPVGRRSDRARTGLGIGLALVRRLVELHSGTVVASSEGVARGSTFTVRLRKSDAPARPAVGVVRRDRRVKPRRVILIENSGEAREMLHMMLEVAGHVVYDAPDAARGLELLDVVHPHVAIVDVRLEGGDGSQVARRIRESAQGRNMLLLALNGRGSHGDGPWPLTNGFDHYLSNPLDPDYLARLIGHEVPAH